ncbi:13165_t:CDS:2, partial [Racocetra persica]
ETIKQGQSSLFCKIEKRIMEESTRLKDGNKAGDSKADDRFLKSLDKSITRELSSSSRTSSFSESIETGGSLLDRVQEKQKKKKKSSKPKPIQSSDLPEISTEGSCQNSSLDILYDLIASIGKNHIEAEEAICESEKCLAYNSSFSPLYLAKVLY